MDIARLGFAGLVGSALLPSMACAPVAPPTPATPPAPPGSHVCEEVEGTGEGFVAARLGDSGVEYVFAVPDSVAGCLKRGETLPAPTPDTWVRTDVSWHDGHVSVSETELGVRIPGEAAWLPIWELDVSSCATAAGQPVDVAFHVLTSASGEVASVEPARESTTSAPLRACVGRLLEGASLDAECPCAPERGLVILRVGDGTPEVDTSAAYRLPPPGMLGTRPSPWHAPVAPEGEVESVDAVAGRLAERCKVEGATDGLGFLELRTDELGNIVDASVSEGLPEKLRSCLSTAEGRLDAYHSEVTIPVVITAGQLRLATGPADVGYRLSTAVAASAAVAQIQRRARECYAELERAGPASSGAATVTFSYETSGFIASFQVVDSGELDWNDVQLCLAQAVATTTVRGCPCVPGQLGSRIELGP